MLELFIRQLVEAREAGIPLDMIREVLEGDESVDLLLALVELEVRNRVTKRIVEAKVG